MQMLKKRKNFNLGEVNRRLNQHLLLKRMLTLLKMLHKRLLLQQMLLKIMLPQTLQLKKLLHLLLLLHQSYNRESGKYLYRNGEKNNFYISKSEIVIYTFEGDPDTEI